MPVRLTAALLLLLLLLPVPTVALPTATASAKGLTLGPLLTDGMVFPSGNGTMAGTAAPSAPILCNFSRAGLNIVERGSADARGGWAVHLQLPPSLTPGTITVISGKDSVTLHNVLVGSL